MIFSQLKKNLENVGFVLIPNESLINSYYILINGIKWKYFLVHFRGIFELRQIETPTTSGELTNIYFTRAVRDFKNNSLRLYFEGKPIVDIYI